MVVSFSFSKHPRAETNPASLGFELMGTLELSECGSIREDHSQRGGSWCELRVALLPGGGSQARAVCGSGCLNSAAPTWTRLLCQEFLSEPAHKRSSMDMALNGFSGAYRSLTAPNGIGLCKMSIGNAKDDPDTFEGSWGTQIRILPL